MPFSILPTDLQNIVFDYAFSLPYTFLKSDIDKCESVQNCIPPSFLVAIAFYSLRWGHVNSPYRKGNAYFPTVLLDLENPWNGVISVLITMIHKEKIRSIRTYKGILHRRANHLYDSEFRNWNRLYKYLVKLKPCHFRHNARQSFLRVVLGEVSEASVLPECD